MASNEHCDMSGNPCDDPITCDWCDEPCNEQDLYGCIWDEDKNFCCSKCAQDYENCYEAEDTP